MRLHLGCYLIAAGQWQQAGQYFQEVQRHVKGDPEHLVEWSVAKLGLAAVAFNAGHQDGALEHLSQFENTLSESPLAPLGILWTANIYAGEEDGFEDAQKRYIWVAKHARSSDLAPRALLSLAVAAMNAEEQDVAEQACNRLIDAYGDSAFAATARTLRRRAEGVRLRQPSASRTLRSDAQRGRIVPFNRHLVIPGHSDFSIDLSNYAAGDVLDYEISYSVRAGCALKHFWYRTSLLEPQAPATDDSPLRFLRAPVLVTAQ